MQTQQLPLWLQQSAHGAIASATTQSRGRRSYLDKTLSAIQRIFWTEALNSRLAERDGYMQRIHARAKVVTVIVLALSAAYSHQIGALLGLHILLGWAAFASGLNWQVYVLRVYLPTICFSGSMLLPALTAWVSPGTPFWTVSFSSLGGWFAQHVPDVVITWQGMRSAAFVMLRAGISLSLVTLLLATTRWSRIIEALGSMRLPSLCVSVLDMTYRYLFLFVWMAQDYVIARKSRIVGEERSSGRLTWTGQALAGLFSLTRQYGGEIAQAMVARGYAGKVSMQGVRGFGWRDIRFLTVIILLAAWMWGGTYFVR